MIVDLKHDRRTVPTPTGKSYPVLFGAGATSTLMYVALNPGAKAPEIMGALEISPASFQRRIERLQDMKLIVGGWRYQINPGVAYEMELVRFLCQYGEALGMPRTTNGRLLKNPERKNKPIKAPLPPDLFGTKNRTNILLMVAALNETYVHELHRSLKIDLCSLPVRMRELVVEGVLTMRIVKRVKCYSLAPDLRGAAWLRTFLRRWGSSRRDIVTAANVALLQRLEIERAGTRRERTIFAELARAGYAAGDMIYGVQRERPPIRLWRRLHGHWNPWRFSRRRRVNRGGTIVHVRRLDCQPSGHGA